MSNDTGITRHFVVKALLLLIGLSAGQWLYGQRSKADTLRIESYYNQLSQYCYSNLDSTLHYLDILLAETQKLGWYEEQAYAYLWGILCTGYHDQIDLKYDLLQQAIGMLAENEKGFPPETLAAIDLDMQMHWGDYYLETGGYSGALEIYEQLATELENKGTWTDEEFQRLVICYQYLAQIHELRGSYQEAIDYCFRSLNYERQYYAQKGAARSDEGQAFSRIAHAYWLMGEKEKALSYHRSAFKSVLQTYKADPKAKSRLRKRMIKMGMELGEHYRELEKADSALYFLQEVMPFTLSDDPITQELRLEKAKVLSIMGQYAAARDTLQRAIAFLQSQPSLGSAFLMGRMLNGRGDILQHQEQYGDALQAYQQALHYLAEDFAATDLKQNPRASLWMAPRELLYTLRQKTRLLLLHPPDKSPDWLQAAWATANVGMDLVDSIKISYTSDYDKQYLLDDSYDLYELALRIAYQGGDAYAEAAFQVMEKSKSVALFAAVRDLHARTYAQVPKEQLEKMQRIRYQLKKADAELEQATTEAQQIGLREKRLQLKLAYEEMIGSFERDYPDYYRLKYSQPPALQPGSFRDILTERQLLVEYFMGEEYLYATAVDGRDGSVKLQQLPWNADLRQWAVELKEDIYQRRDEAFRQKSVALYQALLAPVLEGRDPLHLLVIPDGVLGYLPFDILLTSSVAAGQENNFRTYPFLLQQMAVSQHFSLVMLQEMQQERAADQEALLAFAPSFSGDRLVAERSDRAVLGELLFNKAEAESVLQWFGGKLVAAQQATKQQFLQLAPQFSIYHIASHAVVDDQAPSHSYIAFSGQADSLPEVSRLYTYEILAQSFPADLIVLSACETGLGKVLRGEGIMSLARAFSYAGAGSLVTSLWNINDQSGQTLMDEFYRQLKVGLPKDEALRQAKLAYLAAAPDNARTHPRFWAAFIPTGNMEPLKRSWTWQWGALGVLVLGLGFLLLRRRP